MAHEITSLDPIDIGVPGALPPFAGRHATRPAATPRHAWIRDVIDGIRDEIVHVEPGRVRSLLVHVVSDSRETVDQRAAVGAGAPGRGPSGFCPPLVAAS